ncbi:hypothetical protein A0256_01020 [Mucilaginibacter sp. PAMC 26640]|nr:hypothetical protein A0256_01020 [Mucilaginibacter sp. PAMC 26640]
MISNKLNVIDGIAPDFLKKSDNRIKTPRIKAVHHDYEKFAFKNNNGCILLGRMELCSNFKYSSLLKIFQALGVAPGQFSVKGLIDPLKSQVHSSSD